jgi:hypothetical protein
MRLEPGKGAPVRHPPLAALPAVVGAAPLMGELRTTPTVIADLAGNRDEHLAAVFRQMRAVSGLSETQLARQLGTDISVVMDLESGVVDALPSWPETVRIVGRYSNIAHIDTRPILARLLQLQRRVTPITAPPVRPVSYAVPPPGHMAPIPQALGYSTAHAVARVATGRDGPTVRARQTASSAEDAVDDFEEISAEEAALLRRQRRRKRTRQIALGVMPLVLLAGLIFAVQVAPQPLYAATRALPDAMHAPVKRVVDFAVWQAAPVREGLRWVEHVDPRLRKADRLASK